MSVEKLSVQEISKHNKDTDCWIVVDGNVWDITSFAPEHPGGPGIIYKYAGRDASTAYNEIHAPSIIKEGLPKNALKGRLEESTVTKEWSQPLLSRTPRARLDSSSSEKPPLDSLINAYDFELVAKNTATPKTWAFYSSASNDLITRDANADLWRQVFFRPRVMRRVDKICTATTLLGHESSFPLFISPAAMARLIHPDGELAIARAAHSRNIVQAISNNASYAATEIVTQPQAPGVSSHPFWFQLYVDRVRSKSETLLAKITSHPNITAIMVTTDAAAAGKREADERVKADESILNPMQPNAAKNDRKGGGYGRLMGNHIDPNLNWDDIQWLRAHSRTSKSKNGDGSTTLPLLLKGVMSADDVNLAHQYGLDGVVLSNHGGRNLDTSPPALLVLLEIHARFPHLITQHHPSSPAVRQGRTAPFSIFVDGGIRRGSDILKAICLGAVACGIGRPALFATSYGQEGVEALIDILKDEFEVAMRNCGITDVCNVGPSYVNTGLLDRLVCRQGAHPYAVGFSGSTTVNGEKIGDGRGGFRDSKL